MSGEVVLAPADSGGNALAIAGLAMGVITLGVAGIGLAGAVGVGKVIKGIVDKRVEAATREMEREKACIREWQEYQAEQSRQMLSLQQIQQAISESEKRLSAIRLTQGNIRKDGGGPTAKGYTSSRKEKDLKQSVISDQSIISMLHDISKILESLPREFTNSQSSPYPRLVKQLEKLKLRFSSGKRPETEEIESFKETIARTLDSYMNTIYMERKMQNELAQRLESNLSELLICLNLTSDIKHIDELNSIKANIIKIMNSRNITGGKIELLEKHFRKIKSDIEFNITNTAFRSSLAESMTRNLKDMGYNSIDAFPQDAEKKMLQAAFRMPGGENVRVAIQPNNKISFQVCHESKSKDKIMTEEETAYFKEQEKKWCKDLQELIRRMTVEGFSYNISMERLISETAIPIVVVETVDEILTQDEEEEEEDMDRFYDEPERREML